MKFKLRFESKDMIRFGIFAGVLFVLVVIGVSNLISFANDGTFSGLNVTLAFKKEYILQWNLNNGELYFSADNISICFKSSWCSKYWCM